MGEGGAATSPGRRPDRGGAREHLAAPIEAPPLGGPGGHPAPVGRADAALASSPGGASRPALTAPDLEVPRTSFGRGNHRRGPGDRAASSFQASPREPAGRPVAP